MFEALTKSFSPAANSLTSMQKTAPVEAAQVSLRTTGARVTQPRVQVLATILGSDKALSHHEIEALLAGQSIDRVTVYRVLDWLVGQKLAHRISGQDRIWRFGAVITKYANKYGIVTTVGNKSMRIRSVAAHRNCTRINLNLWFKISAASSRSIRRMI